MLKFLFAFIACINAVYIDPNELRTSAQSLQQSGRMSGNQQITPLLANSKKIKYSAKLNENDQKKIYNSVQKGQKEMIKLIFEPNPTFNDYKYSIMESLENDQKRNFATILKIAENLSVNNHIDILALAISFSFFYNRLDYVDYVLFKVSKNFPDTYSPRWFGEKFIKMYARKIWNPAVENLDYFFSQKVWNPTTVSSILVAMTKAPDNVVERIGMELLNPRLIFNDSWGLEPLEKALQLASTKNSATYGRVLNVLQNIQRKKWRDDIDQPLDFKKPPRFDDPVYLEGFGAAFHPVD